MPYKIKINNYNCKPRIPELLPSLSPISGIQELKLILIKEVILNLIHEQAMSLKADY